MRCVDRPIDRRHQRIHGHHRRTEPLDLSAKMRRRIGGRTADVSLSTRSANRSVQFRPVPAGR